MTNNTIFVDRTLIHKVNIIRKVYGYKQFDVELTASDHFYTTVYGMYNTVFNKRGHVETHVVPEDISTQNNGMRLSLHHKTAEITARRVLFVNLSTTNRLCYTFKIVACPANRGWYSYIYYFAKVESHRNTHRKFKSQYDKNDNE